MTLAATYISTFTGGRCKGNQHAVIDALALKEGDDDQWLLLSQQLAPAILVVVHTQTRQGFVAARFFHHGVKVSWCGSGILAAAKHQQEAGLMVQQITTERSAYAIYRDGDKIGFTVTGPVSWRKPRYRGLWAHLFGETLVRVQESAARKGYILVELRDETAVRKWQPKLAWLKRYSQRALILTAKAPAGALHDYVVRYFAPQYGNDEDAATGSANSLLIPYWALRLRKARLRGEQVSAQGGRFFGRNLSSGVLLMGHANIDAVVAVTPAST